jgi:hypothetical protein
MPYKPLNDVQRKTQAIKLLLRGQKYYAQNPQVLYALMQAKAHSDLGDFTSKNTIIKEMIKARPSEFNIDSEEGDVIGLTHSPSNFKIHTMRNELAGLPKLTSTAQPMQKLQSGMDLLAEATSRLLEKRASVVEDGKLVSSNDPYRFVGSFIDPPEDVEFDEESPSFAKAVLSSYMKKYPKGHGLGFTTDTGNIELKRKNIATLAKLIAAGKVRATMPARGFHKAASIMLTLAKYAEQQHEQAAGSTVENGSSEIRRMDLSEGEKTVEDSWNIKGAPDLKPPQSGVKALNKPVAHSSAMNGGGICNQ